MTKNKSTKKALFASALSLLLCFAMLIGTTYAWFTDSVSSARNMIQSGNLDMKVSYKVLGSDDEWAEVTADTRLFKEGSLYEPGYTEAIVLKIENVGSLAYKADVAVDVYSETTGTNQADESFKLSDHLVIKTSGAMSFTDDSEFENWETYFDTRAELDNFYWAETSLSEKNVIISDNAVAYPKTVEDGKWSTAYYCIILEMPSSVGNEANHKTSDDATNPNKYQPKIELGLKAVATQVPYESDSFGADYDAKADTTVWVSTFEDLKAAFENGGKVVLEEDIAVEEMLTLVAGKNLILDMNGKTMTLAEDADGNVPDPMMDIKRGASITITGNGTMDLEDNYFASLMYPRGEVIIENGNFVRATGGGTEYGSYFVGISGSGGAAKLIIKDGYFDGGYYVAGDCFNNSRNLVNGSWGQYVRIYGGTFVGQNPAWGDEGMAHTCPYCKRTYCQTIFLEGQNRLDTYIPANYTITEGTTEDGRPTYTVNYTAPVEVSTVADFEAAIATGGRVTLGSDIELTETGSININKDTYLDLNGHTIKKGNGAWVIDDVSAIKVETGANLTVANGTIDAGGFYGIYLNGGNVTVKSGTTITNSFTAVNVRTGTAYIQGGEFVSPADPTDVRYVLNCIDANYREDSANIIVTGGTFESFNPADCAAEGTGTNFVETGYKSTEDTTIPGTWIVTKK